MKALSKLYKSFIRALLWNFIKASQKLYKKVASYMFLKEHADFLTKLWKCDWMNVFSTCDIIIVKQV